MIFFFKAIQGWPWHNALELRQRTDLFTCVSHRKTAEWDFSREMFYDLSVCRSRTFATYIVTLLRQSDCLSQEPVPQVTTPSGCGGRQYSWCHRNVDMKHKSSAVADKKASRLCTIIRYMQHCCGTVHFIFYNTDSKSSGYYLTVESTFKSSVTTKTQPTYEPINQFLKQEAQLLPRDHEMHNVNANLNPNRNTVSLTQP